MFAWSVSWCLLDTLLFSHVVEYFSSQIASMFSSIESMNNGSGCLACAVYVDMLSIQYNLSFHAWQLGGLVFSR